MDSQQQVLLETDAKSIGPGKTLKAPKDSLVPHKIAEFPSSHPLNRESSSSLKERGPLNNNAKIPSLCVNCKALIEAIQNLGASNILHGKKTPVWTTSEPLQCESCVLCAHILARIPDAGQKVIQKYQARRSSHIPFRRPKPATITYSVRRSPALGKGQHKGFELSWDHQLRYGTDSTPLELDFTDSGGEWFTELESQLYDRHEDVGVSTYSQQSWDTAIRWLKECSSTHTLCRPLRFLPTRLIDVGPSSRYTIHLRDKTDIPLDASYATLSHCWADSIPTKAQLRSENLDLMKSGIAEDNLPKTFKNAIFATRKLGLRYLWIDSLCIIQNSVEDWRQESRAMGDVYANGYCNLAATASVDSTGGLFRDRNPLVAQSWKVDITMDGKAYPFHLLDFDLWQRNIDGSRLNSRGWVYQERFLSPRTIHYGQDQIFWECRERAACELYPKLARYQIGRTLAWAKQDLRRGRDEAYVYEIWNGVIEAYSCTSLTRVTDKLVAISGLASRLWNVVRDDYCAGLWRYKLEDHLVWRRTSSPVSTISLNYDMRSDRNVQKEFVAPSWSWASLEHGVELPEDIEKREYLYATTITRMFKIDSVQVVLRDWESPFGAIKSGAIEVRGRLGRLPINLDSPDALANDINMLLNDFSNLSSLVIRDKEYKEAMIRRHQTLSAHWKFEGITELYFMPTRYKKDSSRSTYQTTYQGLVLRKTSTGVNCFSRVGFFDCKYCVYEVHDWWMKLYEDFDTERKTSGMRYAPHPEAGFEYKFTIV